MSAFHGAIQSANHQKYEASFNVRKDKMTEANAKARFDALKDLIYRKFSEQVLGETTRLLAELDQKIPEEHDHQRLDRSLAERLRLGLKIYDKKTNEYKEMKSLLKQFQEKRRVLSDTIY